MGANVTELYYFGVGVVGVVCHLYSPFCVFEEKKTVTCNKQHPSLVRIYTTTHYQYHHIPGQSAGPPSFIIIYSIKGKNNFQVCSDGHT